MLGLLRDDGPATATGLARQLGLNTGATSYHLRQLAAHGFVVEDPGRGTGRDRWWRVAHRYTWFDIGAVAPEDRELGAAYLRAVVQTNADRMLRAVDELPALPSEWRAAGTFSEFPLQLTPDELERLLTEVCEVLGRYRPAPEPGSEPAPAGTAPVAFQVQAFPRPGALTGQDELVEDASADAAPPDTTAPRPTAPPTTTPPAGTAPPSTATDDEAPAAGQSPDAGDAR